ncbi:MAG: histidine kinase [Bacteroidales bacterium]
MTITSRRQNIVFNLIFWLVYFLYEWLAMASAHDQYQRYLVNASVIVPITALASIVTVHLLFGRLYKSGRRTEFWVGMVLTMVFFVLVRRGYNYFYVYPTYYPEILETMPFWFLPKMIIEAVNIYLFVGLYSMFYFFRAWYEQERLASSLLKEKSEAELNLLRSQIQPHFIFNTLNNIYSYAIQKHEKTPELIYQLSSFLSYGLYENKAERVSLAKELEIIHCYLDLEHIRYGDRLDVLVNVYDKVGDLQISPLLLLPLVENCFKHGFSTSLEQNWLRLDISMEKGWLVFKLENSLSSEAPANHTNGGIGLSNLRRRLEIVYPDRHEFRVKPGKDSFLVVLKLKEVELKQEMK